MYYDTWTNNKMKLLHSMSYDTKYLIFNFTKYSVKLIDMGWKPHWRWATNRQAMPVYVRKVWGIPTRSIAKCEIQAY